MFKGFNKIIYQMAQFAFIGNQILIADKLERLTAPSASLKVKISFNPWLKPMFCNG